MQTVEEVTFNDGLFVQIELDGAEAPIEESVDRMGGEDSALDDLAHANKEGVRLDYHRTKSSTGFFGFAAFASA
ncbi:MAG: hypothetical protein KDN18_13125 [Verrucomicrobiae bacterium]|nr:hypothetical protein [Verrucomicrobiae bacterium]